MATKIIAYICISTQVLITLTGMNTQPLFLAPGQHWSTRQHGSLTVRCHAGTLWITLPGQLHDHVLQAGDSLRLQQARDALIGALTPATLDLISTHAFTEARHAHTPISGRRLFG